MTEEDHEKEEKIKLLDKVFGLLKDLTPEEKEEFLKHAARRAWFERKDKMYV